MNATCSRCGSREPWDGCPLCFVPESDYAEEVHTVIEYRDRNNKLCEGWFDGPLHAIKREILDSFEQGCFEFVVVRNERDYDFHWLNDYQ